MAAKISVRKMRRLRALLAKHYRPAEPPDPQETMLHQVMMTVLWQDEAPVRARLAFVNLTEEFTDWNEVRVSLASEIGLVLESCGLRAAKAQYLKRILARAIEDLYSFEFERLIERPSAELKSWFLDLEGMPHHIAAAVLYQVYQFSHLLASADMIRVIRRLGLVEESAPDADVEMALDDVVPAKEAHAFHDALHRHATEVCTKTDFECSTCPLRVECVLGKQRLAERKAAAKAAKAAKTKKRAAAKPAAAKRAAAAKRTRKAAKKKPARTTKGKGAKKPARRTRK